MAVGGSNNGFFEKPKSKRGEKLMCRKEKLIHAVIIVPILLFLCVSRGMNTSSANKLPNYLRTATPTSTLAPVPDELLKFDELLQIDPDCLSPCWWGSILGIADGEDSYQFLLNQFGDIFYSSLSRTTLGERSFGVAVEG